MKKIGIITFHNAHNYGATLQCYALSEAIKEISQDFYVSVINYINCNIESAYKVIRLDTKNVKSLIRTMITSIVYLPKNIRRRKKYNQYIIKNLNLTQKCYTVEEVEELVKDYDFLVVGSDQIWNKNLTGFIDRVFYLDFKTKAKKVSYAASLGSSKLDEDIDSYKKMLNDFDEISVREKDAVTIVEKLSNKKVEEVLDPTLIIDRSKWKELMGKRKIKDKYIAVYTPNSIKEFPQMVNYFSDKCNLKIVNFKKSNINYKNVLKNVYTAEPSEFLNYIAYSEYVIATSFHAVVFSLIFHKKFWVLLPKDNASRVKNLLDLVGLTDRYIFSSEDLTKKDLTKEIDYGLVDKKIEKLKHKSIEFLKSALL